MKVINYLTSRYENDENILDNTGFSRHDNLGRMISLIDIPCELLRSSFFLTAQGIAAGFTTTLTAAVVVGIGFITLANLSSILSSTHPKNSEILNKNIKFIKTFSLLTLLSYQSILRYLIFKVGCIATEILGIGLPELGRRARIISRNQHKIWKDYDFIRSSKYEEVAKKAFSALALETTSSEEGIKKAHKKLLLKSHPDKNKKTNATQTFSKDKIKQTKYLALAYRETDHFWTSLIFVIKNCFNENPVDFSKIEFHEQETSKVLCLPRP